MTRSSPGTRRAALFFGSESSDDPAGTQKTFGDVWVATYDNPGGPTARPKNDGKRFARPVVVNRGSSAPEPARQVQRQDGDRGRPHRTAAATTTSTSRGRASPATAAATIYFSRSTDHGATFSTRRSSRRAPGRPVPGHLGDRQRPRLRDLPPVAAQERPTTRSTTSKSTDCGATFAPARRSCDVHHRTTRRTSPIPTAAPRAVRGRTIRPARRRPTAAARPRLRRLRRRTASPATRSSAATRRRARRPTRSTPRIRSVYVVYDPTKPGTQVPTGTTYGSIEPGHRQPVGDLLPARQRRDRGEDRPDADR